MKTFDDFYTLLQEDDIWWDRIKFTYRRKDVHAVAQECFTAILADKNRFADGDIGKIKLYFQKWLQNAKEAPVKEWYKSDGPKPESQPEVKEETPAVSPEEYQKRLAIWLDTIRKAPIGRPVPKLSKEEILQEGGWLPKPKGVYPTTSEAEVIKQQLHIQYIKENYNARTGDKLPTWVSEEEWSQLNQ